MLDSTTNLLFEEFQLGFKILMVGFIQFMSIVLNCGCGCCKYCSSCNANTNHCHLNLLFVCIKSSGCSEDPSWSIDYCGLYSIMFCAFHFILNISSAVG